MALTLDEFNDLQLDDDTEKINCEEGCHQCMAYCSTVQNYTIGCGEESSLYKQCSRTSTTKIKLNNQLVEFFMGMGFARTNAYLTENSILEVNKNGGFIYLCSQHYYLIRSTQVSLWVAITLATISLAFTLPG